MNTRTDNISANLPFAIGTMLLILGGAFALSSPDFNFRYFWEGVALANLGLLSLCIGIKLETGALP
ncbi:MAG: hypothetical protein Q7R64_04420 [bacterium]|nr:hypothetical protein [bacterium]